jgi:hypothetical protein
MFVVVFVLFNVRAGREYQQKKGCDSGDEVQEILRLI